MKTPADLARTVAEKRITHSGGTRFLIDGGYATTLAATTLLVRHGHSIESAADHLAALERAARTEGSR